MVLLSVNVFIVFLSRTVPRGSENVAGSLSKNFDLVLS